MVILAGEIGEVSNLALFTHRKVNGKQIIDPLEKKHIKSYITKDYKENTAKIIEDFLKDKYEGQEHKYGKSKDDQRIMGACFGTAGLVTGKVGHKTATIARTNFSAEVKERDFLNKLPLDTLPIALINDMEAIGHGLNLGNDESHLKVVYEGNAEKVGQEDRRVVMLVSDGLGQAVWYYNEQNKKLEPLSSEGGHCLFAPRTQEEIKLLSHFKKLSLNINEPKQPTSYEYILSKPGLVRIYDFLNYQESGEISKTPDSSNVNHTLIINRAVDTSDALAVKALNMFLGIWGARAGDLALTYNAKGGIYIGGMEIPINTLKGAKEIFLEAFFDKEDHFKDYNKSIPIKMFEGENAVLRGAVQYAKNLGFLKKGILAYKLNERK